MQQPNAASDWTLRRSQADQGKQALKDDIAKLDQQITRLLDRIVATENERLVQSYETKLQELEQQEHSG